MKKINWMMVIAMLAASLLLIPGCKDPANNDPGTTEPPVPVAKDDLEDLIEIAEYLLDEMVVSYRGDGYEIAADVYWYTEADEEAFLDAINAAKAVVLDAYATENAVMLAEYNLEVAIDEVKGDNGVRKLGKADVAKNELQTKIADATTSLNDSDVVVDTDAANVPDTLKWVTAEEKAAFDEAIETAQTAYDTGDPEDIAAALDTLIAKLTVYNTVTKKLGTRQIPRHTVTFKYADGDVITTVQALEGYPLDKPADPAWKASELVIEEEGLYKELGTFAGWYTDAGAEWIFASDLVIEPMSLNAKWSNKITSVAAASIPDVIDYINADTSLAYILVLNQNVSGVVGTGVIQLSVGQNELDVTTTPNFRGKLTIKSLNSTIRTISLASTNSGNGCMFYLSGGAARLTLENIVLQGKNGNLLGLIRVESGATLEMRAGSKITGNNVPRFYWIEVTPGVYVTNHGNFIMSGGEITGNSGASNAESMRLAAGLGLYPRNNNSKITMTGGSITNNMVGTTNRDLRIQHAKQGVLVLSGNDTIGNALLHYDGDANSPASGVIVIPAPFTGSITFNDIYLDTNPQYGWTWGGTVRVFAEGTSGASGYAIQNSDIGRIDVGSAGKSLKPINTTVNKVDFDYGQP